VESEEFAAVVSYETQNKLPLINCLQGVSERNCGERRVCFGVEP
jgi:hypothetical protein